MTAPRSRTLDWPAIARRVAQAIPHTALHEEPMRRALQEHRRETRGGRRASRWAVAFSGGADSLALLLILWAEGEGRWGRGFVALHFNHRLRGREADRDEKFCAEVCASLGVRFVAGHWADAPREASEALARAARQAFFAREMKHRKMRLLWLAHQQDDIAETMLMRISRGSGTAGLAAPRPVQAQPDGRLHLRPLLTQPKRALVDALRAAGAMWREDATNASDRFFRNRVRRTIVPAWAKASGRDVLAAASLTRQRLQEDDDALEQWLTDLKPLDARRGMLDLRRLAGKPRALWRRALHQWLGASGVKTDLSRAGFDRLLSVVEQGKDTRFSLGANAFAVVKANRLKVVAG